MMRSYIFLVQKNHYHFQKEDDMRVNKEVHVRLQQGADDDIELQYNGAAEGKCGVL